MIRFWNKVKKTDTCWLWTAKIEGRGYGRFKIKNKSFMAHRLAWIFSYGEIPPGMFVCHKCDNPPCVRPTHLFIGTPKQNTEDMFKKGRNVSPASIKCSRAGETNPRAKLTFKIVETLRKEYKPGYGGVTSLAKKHGLSTSIVSDVIRRRCWK